MRYLVFLSVILAGVPTLAGTSAHYERALAASEDCKAAWFQTTRKKALAEIEDAAMKLVIALNPLSPMYLVDLRRSKEATKAYESCGKLVLKNQ